MGARVAYWTLWLRVYRPWLPKRLKWWLDERQRRRNEVEKALVQGWYEQNSVEQRIDKINYQMCHGKRITPEDDLFFWSYWHDADSQFYQELRQTRRRLPDGKYEICDESVGQGWGNEQQSGSAPPSLSC
jgi:hypothetical protein